MNPDKDLLSNITDQENFGYTLASPWERLGAQIVEGIIIYTPLYLMLGNNNFLFSMELYDIESTLAETALNVLLGAVFYSLWSGNLGHKIFSMKVISDVDGSDQKSASRGALREGLKNLLGIFIIPSIWLLWDRKNQNLYDKITKTLVVKTNK